MVSSQCFGPVVILNCAGQNISSAPLFAMARTSSGKRISKQMRTPILPYSVSKTVISSPWAKLFDSLNLMPPSISTSNRCILRWRAICLPSLSNTKQVLYSLSPTRSGTEPPIRITPFSRAQRDMASAVWPFSASAKGRKYSFEYGQLHISGRATTLAPFAAASFIMRSAFSMVSALSSSVRSCITAILNLGFIISPQDIRQCQRARSLRLCADTADGADGPSLTAFRLKTSLRRTFFQALPCQAHSLSGRVSFL